MTGSAASVRRRGGGCEGVGVVAVIKFTAGAEYGAEDLELLVDCLQSAGRGTPPSRTGPDNQVAKRSGCLPSKLPLCSRPSVGRGEHTLDGRVAGPLLLATFCFSDEVAQLPWFRALPSEQQHTYFNIVVDICNASQESGSGMIQIVANAPLLDIRHFR